VTGGDGRLQGVRAARAAEAVGTLESRETAPDQKLI